MALPVVTKASGGIAVVDVTATKPGLGVPVVEATNGRGTAITKVSVAVGGLPVVFVSASIQAASNGSGINRNRTGQMESEARGSERTEKRPLLPGGDIRRDAGDRAR
jgi:hypothetical protein